MGSNRRSRARQAAFSRSGSLLFRETHTFLAARNNADDSCHVFSAHARQKPNRQETTRIFQACGPREADTSPQRQLGSDWRRAGGENRPRSAVFVPPWSLARSARSEMSTACRMALTADSQYADRIVPAAVRQWNVRSAASCLQGENCEAPCRTHASTMRSHSAKACTSFFVIMVVARRTPTPSPDSAS